MPNALVLFAGQSNALGFLNTTPADYVPDGRVQIWTDTNGDGQGDEFHYLSPGVNTGTKANPTAWGGEVEFAKEWLAANPTGTLYLGKDPKGEAGLAQAPGLDWSEKSDGELFDHAAATANAMRSNLGVTHLDAVVWVQGETDATTAPAASAYEANFVSFLAAVRAEWMNDAHGHIIAARISDSAALPFNSTVRVAQWAVDQADPYLDTFKTIGFAMQPDGIHYSAPGHVAIGHAEFSIFDAIF